MLNGFAIRHPAPLVDRSSAPSIPWRLPLSMLVSTLLRARGSEIRAGRAPDEDKGGPAKRLSLSRGVCRRSPARLLSRRGLIGSHGSAPLRLCGEDDGGDEHEGSSDENDGQCGPHFGP